MASAISSTTVRASRVRIAMAIAVDPNISKTNPSGFRNERPPAGGLFAQNGPD